MRQGESVFVDSGAWIALAASRDPLHGRARVLGTTDGKRCQIAHFDPDRARDLYFSRSQRASGRRLGVEALSRSPARPEGRSMRAARPGAVVELFQAQRPAQIIGRRRDQLRYHKPPANSASLHLRLPLRCRRISNPGLSRSAARGPHLPYEVHRHPRPARHCRARPHHRRQERACEFEGDEDDLAISPLGTS
jgi:hypothetical protein